MSKSTQHFMNETESLFNVLSTLNSVQISVTHVSHDERLITIEEPSTKQLQELKYSVVSKDTANNLRFIFMNKIKIIWKAKPVIKSLNPKRKKWWSV